MEMQVFYDGLAVISEAMEILYFEETTQAKAIFCKRIQGNILMKVSQRHRLWELLDNEIAEYRMQKNKQMQHGYCKFSSKVRLRNDRVCFRFLNLEER
jgi:hypothetical protein